MKKVIAIFFILSTSISFFPNNAHASIPVVVVADRPYEMKEILFDLFPRIAARSIAKVFIDNTITWLRSGGQGSPLYVTDFEEFLSRAGNRASGEFIENLGLSEELCGPFSAQVSFTLGIHGRSSYEYFDCTLEDVVDNVESFYSDFSSGGWSAWDQLALPQNNAGGAYLMALDAASEIEARAIAASQHRGTASGGILGVQRCTEEDVHAGGGTSVDLPFLPKYSFKKTNCIDVTPGPVVHNAIYEATGKNIDWLVTSDEISELVVALGDFAIQKMMGSGGPGLLDSDDRGEPVIREGTDGISNPAEGLRNGLRTGATDIILVLEETYARVSVRVNATRNNRDREHIFRDRSGCSNRFDQLLPDHCFATCADVDATGNGIIQCGPVVIDGVNGDELLRILNGHKASLENFASIDVPSVSSIADFRRESISLTLLYARAKESMLTTRAYLTDEQRVELQDNLEILDGRLRDIANSGS